MTSTRLHGYSAAYFPRPSPLNLPSQELQLSRPSTPSPTSSLSSFSSGSSVSSCSPGRGASRRRKRVVFADDRGLSLASVRIFTADHSEAETEDPPQAEDKVKVSARPSARSGKFRVRLGFPPPVVDRAALKEVLVQLESCSVTESALSGSVRVCNLRFDKTVFIRVTFDSWRSHQDIECKYVREPQASVETDGYSFNIPLPSELDPKDRVEFLVLFQPGKNCLQFVDNNRGRNYHISVENVAPEPVRLFTQNRRSFVVPSPQRLSVWPPVRGHDPPRTKVQPCRRPLYTERLLHRSWGSLTNLTGPLSA